MQAESRAKYVSSSSFGNIGASANNAFLAPLIIASNVGLATVNAAAESASRSHSRLSIAGSHLAA